jgi:uncharacterized protein (DUF433 family)
MMESKTLEQVTEELMRLNTAVESLRTMLVQMTEGYERPLFYTEHPHVVRVEGVQGGDPIIRGTGKTVRGIIELSRQMTIEDLLEEYEGELSRAQVFDALSYYYDHPNEIEQYIQENRTALEHAWQPRVSS